MTFLCLSCASKMDNIGQKEANTHLYDQRAFPTGEIDHQKYMEALLFREKLKNNGQQRSQPWVNLGPTNIQGRIVDLEMPTDDLNTIYLVSASGGIFKSYDQGGSWEAIFDDAMTLSMGDLDIARSNPNILYAGTGEANAGGGSLAYDGVGIYKSTDAGNSWLHLGLEQVGSIGKVSVHPENPDIVYVAAMGSLFGNNQERGVYKTMDGGISWEQVLYINEMTGAIDLAMHPDDPDIIYACMWQRVRRPQYRDYGGEHCGVYKSVDGGINWTELTNGLPTSPNSKGRIGIAISASNPDVLMLNYADRFGNQEGIFRTEDGGDSWQAKSLNNLNSASFMWWFGKISIDPNDDQTVYYVGFEPSKSTNGGDSWFDTFEGVHVDQHAYFIHPMDSDLVLNGNDGGAYISFDGGENYNLMSDIPTIQFYTCEYDYTDPSKVYGGTQDNGTLRTFFGPQNWSLIYFGDGFVVKVDPDNPTTIYAEYQYGNIAKSTDGGFNFNAADNGLSNADRYNWNTPYILSPHNSSHLYFGTQRLYKSVSSANSWQAISDDLSNGEDNGNLVYGTISSISESPIQPGLLMVGTDDGNVWLSTDDGGSWTKISDSLPLAWVTSVATDPFDDQTIYVSLSGYRYGSGDGNIYRSRDLGQSWENINYNLITVPVNDLVLDPDIEGTVYAATDIGVFALEDDTWDLLAEDMPNVAITDLSLHPPSRKLLAASYGRSMFESQLDPVVSTEDKDFVLANVYPNPTADVVHMQWNDEEEILSSIKIFDTQGVFMGEYNLQDFYKGLDVSGWTHGVYFIIYETNAGKVKYERFMKV